MDEPRRNRPSIIATLAQSELPIKRIVEWIKRHAAWVIVTLGIVARLFQYAAGVRFWLDEGALASNIVPETRGPLFGRLGATQLATPGFLAVERLVCDVLGESERALRLVPFLGGVASLVLAVFVCRRWLKPRAALIALGLLAVSDDLIYFSAELKQYSTDVTAALGCLLAGLSMRDRPVTLKRGLGFGLLGALLVWFSHPSAFVLAGVGSTLIGVALLRREWREAMAFTAIAATWGTSFGVVYITAMNQLGHAPDMWHFWRFAFPIIPPKTLWEATWLPRRLLYLFVNPLSFETPLGVRASIVVPVVCFVIGFVSMWRRDRILLTMLLTPLLFTLMATCLRLYPFHGRLVLFLTPALLLIIAEGACAIGERFQRRSVWAAVLIPLFFVPCVSAVYRLGAPRDHGEFSPYGDRRFPNADPARFPF